MNTALKIIFAVLIGLMLVPFKGYAKDGKGGVQLDAGFWYSSQTVKDTVAGGTNAQSVTASSLLLNPVLGYKFNSGLFVGGEYMSISTSSGNPTTTLNDSGYGPTVGFYKSGIRITGTYIFSAEAGYSSSVKLQKGSGFQAGLGYAYQITDSFGFGAKFVYYSLAFKEKSTNPAALSSDYTKSGIVPEVLLSFTF